MMTTKKRCRFHFNLVVVAAVGTLLTACGPPGARQLRKGEKDIQTGQFGDAVMALKEATRILVHAPPPMQAKAWNLLGLASMESGQLDAAAQAYMEALKLDRNNAVVDYNLGCLRSQQGDFVGAVGLLTTYTTLRPKDAQGYLRRGTAYFHYALGRPVQEKIRFLDDARRDFDTAERLAATAEAANALGVLDVYRRAPGADSAHSAAANFTLALKRDPHCAPALLNLAIVSQQYLKDPRQALQLYRQYLAFSPSPPRFKEVTKLANDLELSLHPAVTAEAAPAPAPVTTPAPRPSPPPAKTNLAPSNPIVSVPIASVPTASNQAVSVPIPKPPPAQEPTVVVVVPAPEPAPAPATDPVPLPQATPQLPPPISNPPATVQAPPETRSTVIISNDVPEPVVAKANPPPRKTITERLNPMNWFSGKAKTQNGGSSSGTAAEPPLVPAGAHYEYSPPVTPIPGDRAEAKRLVAEAVRARQAGDLAQSIRAYKDAVAADSTYYEARYGLGLASMDARDYTTALEALHRALLLQTDSAEARYAFAWALQKHGYTEDAVHELGALLGQHPDDVRGHLLLGSLYADKLHQPKLAREQYTKALALDPNNAQAANIREWLNHN